MPALAHAERPRVPRRAWALLALWPLTGGCAGSVRADAWLASGLGALALGVAALVGWLLTERRRRRGEAATWQDAVRIAELTRVGAFGELEGFIDHELGTPVASILNNLGAARRLVTAGDASSPPDLVTAVDEARTEGERAALAIRQMRTLFGADVGRREALDLNALAGRALALVARHAASGGVTLTAALARPLPPVQGNQGQLLQVALGLTLAAVDNASSAGRGAVVVRTAVADGWVELTVRDSGAARSELERAHLFTPRSSLRPSGLGLDPAVTRSIVEAHGGRISAERPDSGALVRVVLPAAAAPQLTMEASEG